MKVLENLLGGRQAAAPVGDEQTDADRVRPLATKVLALLAIAMARLSKTQLVCAHPQTEKVVRASADKALVEWAAVMKAHKAASAASNAHFSWQKAPEAAARLLSCRAD